MTNAELVAMVSKALTKFDFTPQSTLLASSLCADEVNRPLEQDLARVYGHHFSMGGLAGFPFGGVTAFGAMAAHIPDGGNCLVVYGPHVGVNSEGTVGTVERVGRAHGGSCCGSAVAAAGFVKGGGSGDLQATSDPIDAQQMFVGNMLMPHAARLAEADDEMVELPLALYDAQDELMGRIVEKAGGNVANGKIALLGGVQINTPVDMSDYFLPLRFEVRKNDGEVLGSLL